MTQVAISYARTDGSPFDAIKHVDPDGSEWWSARELMPLLGYSKWERFADAIDRARAAATNSGQDPDQAISRIREMVPQGGASRVDYRLTRYGAYLVALNGDPRKLEIAAAQSYFVVKAREAEVTEQRHARSSDDLDVIEKMVHALRADRQRLTVIEAAQAQQSDRQRELEARMDGIEGLHDWFSALAYAKMNGLNTELSFVQRLGTAAARITRRNGLKPKKTQHSHFGTVNLYPISALDEAAELMGVA